MKQDKAEAQAIADALLHRMQALPIIDKPFAQCLAPDFVLFAPPIASGASTEKMGPKEKGIPSYLLPKWSEQRDFFAQKASSTAHSGAIDAEWARMPMAWRIVLLMMGGVGDLNTDLDRLAARSWQIIPPPERDGIRSATREAFALLSRTQAMRLRTTG